MNSKRVNKQTKYINNENKLKNMTEQIPESQEHINDLQIKLDGLEHKYRTTRTMADIFNSKLNSALNRLYREVTLGTKKPSDVLRCYEYYIGNYMDSLRNIDSIEEEEEDEEEDEESIKCELRSLKRKMSNKRWYRILGESQ
jgi:DNA repair ATPase RecN